jgi:hypothetical protein
MKEKDTPIIEAGHPQTSETSLISEERRSAVVLSFGRMNPITSGHQKLVDKLVSVARRKKATPELYLSHSHDKKKNPLTYDDKIRYATKAFGKVVKKSKAKTIMQVLAELDKKYSEVYIVVGSDRLTEFDNLVQKYNGKDYNYDVLEVVSAGERDPDADDVSGMSGSKLRQLAVDGHYNKFVKGVPRKFSDADAKAVYDKIREWAGINEEITLEEVLNIQQRMKRRMMMRRIKGKIARGRRIARKKIASPDKIKKRSNKKAREMVRKRLAGARGKNYKDLPVSAKIEIDKKVNKKASLIKQLAKRLLPKVKSDDRARLARARTAKKESYQMQGLTDQQYLFVVEECMIQLEKETIAETIEKNLRKKSEKYDIAFESIKDSYVRIKREHGEDYAFDYINHQLAQANKDKIHEAIDYHIENNIPFSENIFRNQSNSYFRLFREAKISFEKGLIIPGDSFDVELLQTDIGEHGLYEGTKVPLDCPMVELDEEEKEELNKPKRGGPKKFYVFVKDPQTGNVKKVTFGDTSGLKAKIDNPEARKSFAARHDCANKKDKTKPGYWACRLPSYAKSLGLSGGGNFFW